MNWMCNFIVFGIVTIVEEGYHVKKLQKMCGL